MPPKTTTGAATLGLRLAPHLKTRIFFHHAEQRYSLSLNLLNKRNTVVYLGSPLSNL
jgi:hypothetical protein